MLPMPAPGPRFSTLITTSPDEETELIIAARSRT